MGEVHGISITLSRLGCWFPRLRVNDDPGRIGATFDDHRSPVLAGTHHSQTINDWPISRPEFNLFLRRHHVNKLLRLVGSQRAIG